MTAIQLAKRAVADRESLQRGSRPMPTGSNDSVTVRAFQGRGIPPADVITFGAGQNVRTYRAWRALGRQVRKGEKSVRLTVYIPMLGKEPINPGSKEVKVSCRPVTACVFHVSQTDETNGKGGASC